MNEPPFEMDKLFQNQIIYTPANAVYCPVSVDLGGHATLMLGVSTVRQHYGKLQESTSVHFHQLGFLVIVPVKKGQYERFSRAKGNGNESAGKVELQNRI